MIYETKVKIAIVANYSWLGISPPLVNCITNLLERDIYVTLFCDRPDFKRFPLPFVILDHKNFELITINGAGRGILGDIYFLIVSFLKFKLFDHVIAFDHQAVLRGFFISKVNKVAITYWNLEFFIPFSLLGKVNKVRERFVARKAIYLITQDNIRANWLHESLRQDINKFRVVYNSPRGVSNLNNKNYYFHNKFSIPHESKIVLMTGSLIPEHLILESAISSIGWRSNIVLVLHGWFSDELFKKEIYTLSTRYPDKIFISEELLSDENKMLPFLSCDVGLIGYTRASINHSLVGTASGKFFDFMKVGKPILLIDTVSLNDIVAKFDIGQVVKDLNSVQGHLDHIFSEYLSISENCLSCFSEFEFDKNFESLFRSIQKYCNS